VIFSDNSNNKKFKAVKLSALGIHMPELKFNGVANIMVNTTANIGIGKEVSNQILQRDLIKNLELGTMVETLHVNFPSMTQLKMDGIKTRKLLQIDVGKVSFAKKALTEKLSSLDFWQNQIQSKLKDFWLFDINTYISRHITNQKKHVVECCRQAAKAAALAESRAREAEARARRLRSQANNHPQRNGASTRTDSYNPLLDPMNIMSPLHPLNPTNIISPLNPLNPLSPVCMLICLFHKFNN
jgi:hypothetical protein